MLGCVGDGKYVNKVTIKKEVYFGGSAVLFLRHLLLHLPCANMYRSQSEVVTPCSSSLHKPLHKTMYV